MTKYVLLAESGSDITPEYAAEHNIRIVPMHVILGDAEYNDGALTLEEIFAYFDATGLLPKTSACTPFDYTKAFDEIHERFPEALILHLAYSAITTSSYESALSAAEGRDYVRHYDTKNVSIGQGAVVMRVSEFLEKNPEAELETVEAVIMDSIKRVRMVFLPFTLAYLHAGGRLSNLAFIGSQLLKIRPLVEILDGKLVATKKFRGSMLASSRKLFTEYLEEHTVDKDYLILMYANSCNEEIKNMSEGIAREAGFKEVVWMRTGGVISSHGGPDAFGFTCFLEE